MGLLCSVARGEGQAMKVFEVRWESLGDDDIITETIEYATHEDDCLMGGSAAL